MSDQSANEHGSPVTFRFSNIGAQPFRGPLGST